jgi:DNA polymerase I
MELIFDVEATGAQRNHAHPYDHRNVMCNIGVRIDGKNTIYKIQYDDDPYGEALEELKKLFSKSSVVVGFNLKYDLHWLNRYGIFLPDNCRVFDCQLAYYILDYQQTPYPSLNGVAEKFGLESKLDVVKLEYWDKGLDTNQVPYEVLCEYLEQDLVVTEQVYHRVKENLNNASDSMRKLVSLAQQDLVVLQDIEKNGLLLHTEKSIEKGNELVDKIRYIDVWLRKIFNAEWFNPNSGDHLSVFLYGGTLELDGKEEYTFTYKDGRTVQKTRNAKIPFTSKGLFKPLERTQLAKEGFYATNEGTLKVLQQRAKGEHKQVITTLLERAKLEKLRSTYYHGLPKKLEEYGWTDGIIHSSFNQCVAGTGRLTSTKPNVQNLAGDVDEVFISRF